MENLNLGVINEITKHLRKGEKPVNYLMDKLCIGKESAYRRLKNQIPFTFEEIVKIANDLDFSIDQLAKKDIGNRVYFDLPVNVFQDPLSIYNNMLEYDLSIIKQLSSAKKLSIVCAINRIPFRFFPFKTLFKYEYCKYLYSNGYLPLTEYFANIAITPYMEQLHKEIAHHFNLLRNVVCVIDYTIVSKIISEIYHFHELGFVSDNDLLSLQSEGFDFLALFERMIRTGEKNYNFYYSTYSIDANSVYYEYDGNIMSQIWLFPENQIVINNNRLLYTIQKNWLDANIRNSTLISKSNHTLQIKFIKEVYNQISELHKQV